LYSVTHLLLYVWEFHKIVSAVLQSIIFKQLYPEQSEWFFIYRECHCRVTTFPI